jgi:type II secretory pathway predicted ATPase ExeA
MPGLSYERYGLTGNPFRDLATENLEDVTIFHVNQDVDQSLQAIREEVYDKENRAVIALIGELGAGKTERLRFTTAEAKERKAFSVYFDVSEKAPMVLRGLAAEFSKAAKEAGLVKTFGGPSWLRPMAALEKVKDEKYDAAEAGRTIARALNESAPAFLLLNDLHNLIESREVDAFVKVLQEVANGIKPGALTMFSCYTTYLPWISVNHPAFAQRINRTFLLTKMKDDEAALLLAKKLLVKRVVEDLDPTYPFDSEAVSAINAASEGNPRRILELADVVMEYAVAHRAYRVDHDTVQAVLAARRSSDVFQSGIRPAQTTPTNSTTPAPTPIPSRIASSKTPAVPNYRETDSH